VAAARSGAIFGHRAPYGEGEADADLVGDGEGIGVGEPPCPVFEDFAAFLASSSAVFILRMSR
jgi:hypothetical protein